MLTDEEIVRRARYIRATMPRGHVVVRVPFQTEDDIASEVIRHGEVEFDEHNNVIAVRVVRSPAPGEARC